MGSSKLYSNKVLNLLLPNDNQNGRRLLPQLLGKNYTSRKVKIMIINISFKWFKSSHIMQ